MAKWKRLSGFSYADSESSWIPENSVLKNLKIFLFSGEALRVHLCKNRRQRHLSAGS
jgi:hypothetical protein